MADKHVENEQVRGIVNLGGDNTFKNVVVDGKNVDDKLNKDNKADQDKKDKKK